jgi:hypothetical protein
MVSRQSTEEDGKFDYGCVWVRDPYVDKYDRGKRDGLVSTPFAFSLALGSRELRPPV